MNIQPYPIPNRQVLAGDYIETSPGALGLVMASRRVPRRMTGHALPYDGVTSGLLVLAEGAERLADPVDFPLVRFDRLSLYER